MITFRTGRLRRKEFSKQKKINERNGLINHSKKILNKRKCQLDSKNFKSEKWFKDLLLKHLQIDYPYTIETNKPVVNRYFVDFWFKNINLAVEIDGYSHDNSKEYDSKRDLEILKHCKFIKKIERIKTFDLNAALKLINQINKDLSLNSTKAIVAKKPILLPRPKRIKKSIYSSKPEVNPITLKKMRIIKSWERDGLDVEKMKKWFNL